jgi:hypothetical protein
MEIDIEEFHLFPEEKKETSDDHSASIFKVKE